MNKGRKTSARIRLEELRKARQTTQAEVAQNLGVYQGEVSKIEHRKDICLSSLCLNSPILDRSADKKTGR
jgi:transcriptional regulator with XRE-family HTH domain